MMNLYVCMVKVGFSYNKNDYYGVSFGKTRPLIQIGLDYEDTH